MTDLYRGLLQLLVIRCIEQIDSIRTHIRSHNSGHSKSLEIDIGVTGFWNLMLETVFTIFSILFVLTGVCLTALLAIISYPFAAFINYGAWLLLNTKSPKDTYEDQPKIIKKEKENNGL